MPTPGPQRPLASGSAEEAVRLPYQPAADADGAVAGGHGRGLRAGRRQCPGEERGLMVGADHLADPESDTRCGRAARRTSRLRYGFRERQRTCSTRPVKAHRTRSVADPAKARQARSMADVGIVAMALVTGIPVIAGIAWIAWITGPGLHGSSNYSLTVRRPGRVRSGLSGQCPPLVRLTVAVVDDQLCTGPAIAVVLEALARLRIDQIAARLRHPVLSCSAVA